MEPKTCPVIITDSAMAELKKGYSNNNLTPNHALRIGVNGSDENELQYLVGFDLPLPEDVEYSQNNFKIIIHQQHQLYVAGLVLDYVDEEKGKGFVFMIPGGGCGCGHSHNHEHEHSHEHSHQTGNDSKHSSHSSSHDTLSDKKHEHGGCGDPGCGSNH